MDMYLCGCLSLELMDVDVNLAVVLFSMWVFGLVLDLEVLWFS